MLIVFIFCLVICLPMFYFPCLSPQLKKCQFPEDLTGKLTLLDAIIYSYLPFIFTFIFSSMTLVILFKSGQLLKSVSIREPHETTSIASIRFISKTRNSIIPNENEINIKVWIKILILINLLKIEREIFRLKKYAGPNCNELYNFQRYRALKSCFHKIGFVQ